MIRKTVLAPAKLNLFLEITGRRSDGYHLIDTIMQSVSLYDEVTVTADGEESGINIFCTDENVPCDETNTAYKAVVKFFEYAQIKPAGISVKIKKRIPSQAGMAGGSADAAAVITALNEMFETNFSQAKLAEIGEEIGADVPFCIYGGTMSAGGIGTILTPLPNIPDCYFVIVKPDISVSTKDAYQKCDGHGYDMCRSSDKITDSICSSNLREIGKRMYNKFEEVIDIPEIEEIKNCMKKNGAFGACLTGSGSAVFGIFGEKSDADTCFDELKETFAEVCIVKPVFSD